MGTVSVERSVGAVPVVRPARAATPTRLAAWVVPSVLLGGAFVVLRVAVALTPILRETYYDEALTGLMSLQILRGVPQVFYWGQPYLGALDAYLAAAAFYLFGPSTLALRLGTAWVSIFWLWAAWRIGTRIAGPRWGLFAGLQLALPPIFVSYIQLSSHAEGVSLALGTVTLALAVRLVDEHADGRTALWAWAFLGMMGGLAWWMSQMTAMLLVAAALGLLVARPRALREAGPYLALALFGLGSLPFWVWNVRHDWATFFHLLTWGDPMPAMGGRVTNLTLTVVQSLRGGFWDGRAVVLPGWARLVGDVAVAGVYGSAVGLAVGLVVAWGRRLWRRERPWQTPLDLVGLAFWLTVLAHLVTWFGTSGVLRYAITFYGPLPLLAAAALARLGGLGRIARATAIGLASALLAFNLVTHVEFVRAGAGGPPRPVDAAIERLAALGVQGCYADSRIAQVLTFESVERITCADYVGLRNFGYLQAVDRIEDPARVAIVTHTQLRNPDPADMARALQRIGAAVQQTPVGEYVIFHGAVSPDDRVRSIPAVGWRARASTDADHAASAFDRQVWTRWTAPMRPGHWIEVDLGAIRPVSQISVLASPWVNDAPAGLRVELSADGRAWTTVWIERALLPGLHWWKGHPRLDDSGQVLVRFTPLPARYLRLTQVGAASPKTLWSVSELFVYEQVDAPERPPASAVDALADARRALGHWMDDPGGPHPRRAPVTYEHRRSQVPWARAFAASNRALEAAPEWEDAHHLYAQDLTLSGWSDAPDRRVDRAFDDGAWVEVTRWASLAESTPNVPNVSWRAGRRRAWAEALDRLGRPAEASALRAAPAPVPSRPTQIRFGSDLDLVGVDIPDRVRPGETVALRYHWRLRRPVPHDYWVFLHLPGFPGNHNFDQIVGEPGYGVSLWPADERLTQTVTLRVPRDTPPGVYPLRLGLWLPSTGRRLRIAEADLPQHHRAVALGALTVAP